MSLEATSTVADQPNEAKSRAHKMRTYSLAEYPALHMYFNPRLKGATHYKAAMCEVAVPEYAV